MRKIILLMSLFLFSCTLASDNPEKQALEVLKKSTSQKRITSSKELIKTLSFSESIEVLSAINEQLKPKAGGNIWLSLTKEGEENLQQAAYLLTSLNSTAQEQRDILKSNNGKGCKTQ